MLPTKKNINTTITTTLEEQKQNQLKSKVSNEFSRL